MAFGTFLCVRGEILCNIHREFGGSFNEFLINTYHVKDTVVNLPRPWDRVLMDVEILLTLTNSA
jgi:hypothetical protein